MELDVLTARTDEPPPQRRRGRHLHIDHDVGRTALPLRARSPGRRHQSTTDTASMVRRSPPDRPRETP